MQDSVGDANLDAAGSLLPCPAQSRALSDRVRSRVHAAETAVQRVLASPELVHELSDLAREVFQALCVLLDSLEFMDRVDTITCLAHDSADVPSSGNEPERPTPFTSLLTDQSLDFWKTVVHFRKVVGHLSLGGRKGVREICEGLLNTLNCLSDRAKSPASSGFSSGHAIV
jgi:hypothetical protein